ncbi:MAG: class I SAM-dependent methyltransferase [Ilumatobacteraceae bacterium]
MSQRSLDELLSVVHDVEGWLSTDQAARLYAAAAATGPGDQIVEIGSFRGRSTIVLAGAAPDDVSIIAIDPHAGNDRGPNEIRGFESHAAVDHDAFNANLAAAGVADRVQHIREFSGLAHEAVTGTIAVLYIDGAHRYAPARADIHRWGSRVESGGTMLIHDSFSSVGVTLAISRELMLGGRFRYIGRTRSLTEYRADLDDTAWRRAVNTFRQIAQLPWFVKNLFVKVVLTVRLGWLVTRLTGRMPEWPY